MYYDERAEDYGDKSRPSDRRVRNVLAPALSRALVDELEPRGRVLELACGTGRFTTELARHAETVTAVDGSPRMLKICRSRLDHANVSYVLADVFDWEPTGLFDVVFFGFWLSHVPADTFATFWALVRRCLAPQGRVAFVDEDDRAAAYDDVRLIDGVPAARRTLADGRAFDVVKVFWRPADLEARLRASGWDLAVRRVDAAFLYGVGQMKS